MKKSTKNNVVLLTLYLIIALVSVALLIFSEDASADAIYVGGITKHLYRDYDSNGDRLNEKNMLVAYQTGSFISGLYDNSYGDPTAFAGKVVHIGDWEYIELDLVIIGTYGYSYCFGLKSKLCGAIVPGITYKRYNLQPTLKLFGDAATLGVRYVF